MKRLRNIDIFSGQLTIAAAARHIANRAGTYSGFIPSFLGFSVTGCSSPSEDRQGDTLLLPWAEAEAVSILNAKWQDLEVERARRKAKRRRA